MSLKQYLSATKYIIGNYFESEYPWIEDGRPPRGFVPDNPGDSGLCEVETEHCVYLPILAREANLKPFPVKRGTSYYYADSQRIAMRTGGEAYLLFGDHLGSSSLLVRADGTEAEKAYYLPWGGERGNTSITSTDYGYTGQMREGDIYYYGARWYDPSIGRFMQADTIVPLNVQGTQAFDRYAYVNNNPLRYTDPTGHYYQECGDDNYGRCGTIPPTQKYNIIVCGVGDGNNCEGSTPNTPLYPYHNRNGENLFFDVDQFGSKFDTSNEVLRPLSQMARRSKVRLIGHSAGADAIILIFHDLLLSNMLDDLDILGIVLLDPTLTATYSFEPGNDMSTYFTQMISSKANTFVGITMGYDTEGSIIPIISNSELLAFKSYTLEVNIPLSHTEIALSTDIADQAKRWVLGGLK